MPESTRRGFIKIAGAGVAAVGVAAVTPSALAHTSHPAQVALPKSATGSMVAYIHDVKSGQVAVMVEGREVTITDHQLVAKLAQALHSDHSAL